jgi:REP element-mobilizing transposase RayT
MSRPLRIEFPGAVYHVTSRGDRREPIFDDDVDRQLLLDVLAHGTDRFDAQVLAYCLMGNHYHFVLYTRSGNLSRLMRHLNGVYTQAYNRRNGKVGHLFQGRFKAILVDRDAYLLEVCRYVELNPVRAGMVPSPEAWPWSSYRAHVGQTPTPHWLDTAGLHGYLLGREAVTSADQDLASARYVQLVAQGQQGQGVDLWARALNKQIYLGDDDFVERMQQQLAAVEGPRATAASKTHSKASTTALSSPGVPKVQRSHPRTLKQWLQDCPTREEALRCAYVHSGISMTQLAKEVGLTLSRVSQLIARAEKIAQTKKA